MDIQRVGPNGIDRLIAGVAARQGGVVGRSQLTARGISLDRIDGRLKRGSLHRVHRGVYAVGHPALGLRGLWFAALLAGGPGAVLSHKSAAQAWGLLSRRDREIEITRARGWRAPSGVISHVGAVPGDERTEVDGIPVTSVPRTVLDLAAVLDRHRLERVVNEVEVRQLTDRLSMPDLLSRHPRRRGTARLRAILDDWTVSRGVTANHFEERLADLITAYRLTRPRFNADIWVRGRHFRPDAAWEREMVIVELDGRAAHGTTAAFESDRERDRLLQLEGWRIVRITWLQLRDEPEVIARDLRELLSRSPASTL